ncbi:hypothetical protein [Dyella sp. ASV21]|uniref:hypothetical protein n=1 Tax=Dyella sp. ASV21 TaxID=2795114 RepID=UPI0018EDB65E|nr:hypothetical protein [Dyella sp. ASV21]
MKTNARVRAIAGGVTAEMIAEQVNLIYNAQSGSGAVTFQGRECLFVNGQFEPLAGSVDILPLPLDAILHRCFATDGQLDPVTGVDLGGVSAAGVMLVIKAAYDVLYNERAASFAQTFMPEAPVQEPAPPVLEP